MPRFSGSRSSRSAKRRSRRPACPGRTLWSGDAESSRCRGDSIARKSEAKRRKAMHAVIVKVSINEAATATEYLRETIVPGVSQAPGFVAGYWVRLEGDEG